MTKILIMALATIILATISIFFIFFLKPQNFSKGTTVVTPQGKQNSSPIKNGPDPLPVVTNSVQEASTSALENRVKTLEGNVIDLQKQLNNLKSTTTQVAQPAVVVKAPLYIPLGTGASSSSLDWETSNAVQATIDPAQYPGYTSMQLEMGLQVFQGNGTAYARLFDADDGSAINNSDIFSPNEFFTWQTSSQFRLPSGSKTYKIQLRSNTTYQASEQNARIKVNF